MAQILPGGEQYLKLEFGKKRRYISDTRGNGPVRFGRKIIRKYAYTLWEMVGADWLI